MYQMVQDIQTAENPQSLRNIYKYKQMVHQEYGNEIRETIAKYTQAAKDPLREVGRMELKGNRQRKTGGRFDI